MQILLNIICLLLMLGIIVFVHELGHFIFAKRSGIYVYEFSIGMGPVIFKKNRKNDETDYCIRAFPIGGFVQMAGEEVEDDTSVPKDKKFATKTFSQQFMTVFAGIMNNFIFAIILLFIVALFSGAPQNKTYVGEIDKNYPAYTSGLQTGDRIIKVNNKRADTGDLLTLQLQANNGKEVTLDVERNGQIEKVKIKPKKIKEDGNTIYRYGFVIDGKMEKGFIPAIKYAFSKTISLLHQMLLIIVYLCTGKLSLSALSGPVGIYSIVGEATKSGILTLLYLTAYISINVGFINFLPLPAFDGGRLWFLVIEKITGKKLDPKVENTIHAVGFILLMILMVLITIQDITRLIK